MGVLFFFQGWFNKKKRKGKKRRNHFPHFSLSLALSCSTTTPSFSIFLLIKFFVLTNRPTNRKGRGTKKRKGKKIKNGN